VIHGAVFVDWVSITEFHPGGGLPLCLDGIQATFDAAGNCRFERALASSVGGSYDTSVRIRCDGFRVTLSGNPGRFSRQDNLFNYGIEGTLQRANRILATLGLPAFRSRVDAQAADRHEKAVGARLSRIDLTCNFSAGSDARATAVIRWLAGRSIARMKRGYAGDQSVWWSNSRHMLKAYRKGAEMKAHGMDKENDLVKYCDEHGIVRVEVELKRRLLDELGLAEIGNITDEKLAQIFHDQTEPFRRVDMSEDVDVLDSVPLRSRAYAAAWLAGHDLRQCLSNGTLYRHAKVLREHGLDILEPRNIERFPVKVRVIDLVPLLKPDWYDLEAA